MESGVPPTLRFPLIYWAQRKDRVMLTVAVPFLEVEKLELNDETRELRFSAWAGGQRYAFDFELFGEIVEAESKWSSKGRHLELTISKKDKTSDQWWPRLIKDKTRNPHLKIDWDRWIEPDDEAEETEAYDQPQKQHGFGHGHGHDHGHDHSHGHDHHRGLGNAAVDDDGEPGMEDLQEGEMEDIMNAANQKDPTSSENSTMQSPEKDLPEPVVEPDSKVNQMGQPLLSKVDAKAGLGSEDDDRKTEDAEMEAMI